MEYGREDMVVAVTIVVAQGEGGAMRIPYPPTAVKGKTRPLFIRLLESLAVR